MPYNCKGDLHKIEIVKKLQNMGHDVKSVNALNKVMEKMAKVQEVVGKVLDQPENMIVQEESKSEEFEKIEENQQALLTKMQALEDSLNSHMNTVVDKVQEIPGVGRELVEELKIETEKEIKENVETNIHRDVSKNDFQKYCDTHYDSWIQEFGFETGRLTYPDRKI